MRVTWMGHACFTLEQDGFRIVIDPYTGVPGYPPLALEADRVECSHGHFDHNAVSAVRLRPGAGTGPFTVEEIPTFHDDAGGALRGGNTVRVFSAAEYCAYAISAAAESCFDAMRSPPPFLFHVTTFRRRTQNHPADGGVVSRLSKKYYFFDKGVCGLTAAHALSAGGGRRARLQAEKYFLRRTCRRRK